VKTASVLETKFAPRSDVRSASFLSVVVAPATTRKASSLPGTRAMPWLHRAVKVDCDTSVSAVPGGFAVPPVPAAVVWTPDDATDPEVTPPVVTTTPSLKTTPAWAYRGDHDVPPPVPSVHTSVDVLPPAAAAA